MDANFSYWKTELDYKNIDETAFVTHHKARNYLEMPFERENAIATF